MKKNTTGNSELKGRPVRNDELMPNYSGGARPAEFNLPQPEGGTKKLRIDKHNQEPSHYPFGHKS